MEEGRSAFTNLTGKPTGKRLLRSFRLSWKENIRKYLKETGVDTRNWIDSA